MIGIFEMPDCTCRVDLNYFDKNGLNFKSFSGGLIVNGIVPDYFSLVNRQSHFEDTTRLTKAKIKIQFRFPRTVIEETYFLSQEGTQRERIKSLLDTDRVETISCKHYDSHGRKRLYQYVYWTPSY